uniref:Aminoacyl tRNA synthase complex-interacting multifunctional protein 2 n=1 Tax=Corethrella appendiculata TaxID=1370023 RepID=U5EZS6_9DIPT
MYEIKPILQKVEIDLPNCMYKIKSIHATSNNVVSNNQKNYTEEMPELEELAARQAKILQQLAELKEQLLSMRTDLKLCNKPAQQQQQQSVKAQSPIKTVTKQVKLEPINVSYLKDFVVNADPATVPFSLIALKNLWLNRLNLIIECFTHSNIEKLTDDAILFQRCLEAANKNTNESLPKLKISLIWKKIDGDTEMIASPILFVPIYGETNIIRFLSRIGPNEYNYELDVMKSTEIDQLLDACHILPKVKLTKERQTIMCLLNDKLGKSKYFGGEEISMVDIAVSSTLTQFKTILSKIIAPNLKQWHKRVTEIFNIE